MTRKDGLLGNAVTKTSAVSDKHYVLLIFIASIGAEQIRPLLHKKQPWVTAWKAMAISQK